MPSLIISNTRMVDTNMHLLRQLFSSTRFDSASVSSPDYTLVYTYYQVASVHLLRTIQHRDIWHCYMLVLCRRKVVSRVVEIDRAQKCFFLSKSTYFLSKSTSDTQMSEALFYHRSNPALFYHRSSSSLSQTLLLRRCCNILRIQVGILKLLSHHILISHTSIFEVPYTTDLY